VMANGYKLDGEYGLSGLKWIGTWSWGRERQAGPGQCGLNVRVERLVEFYCILDQLLHRVLTMPLQERDFLDSETVLERDQSPGRDLTTRVDWTFHQNPLTVSFHFDSTRSSSFTLPFSCNRHTRGYILVIRW
jgi:hypothetical protein